MARRMLQATTARVYRADLSTDQWTHLLGILESHGAAEARDPGTAKLLAKLKSIQPTNFHNSGEPSYELCLAKSLVQTVAEDVLNGQVMGSSEMHANVLFSAIDHITRAKDGIDEVEETEVARG